MSTNLDQALHCPTATIRHLRINSKIILFSHWRTYG